jgi:hypothetical protein
MPPVVKDTAVAAPVAVERVSVGFSGDGAGVGELSWGQMEIWRAMLAQNSSLALGGTRPMPPGTTVPEVADELRYLISRYATMRTRVRLDASGRPTQEVFGSGEIALAVFDAGDADPQEVAAAVDLDWTHRAFDYADEWPVRMGVVTKNGAVASMVVRVCHLAMDGPGAQVMLREVATKASDPITGMQSLEQSRWQRSPAGRRQNAVAQRYWDRVLRAVPAQRAPDSTDPRSPRHWGGRLHSHALRLSVQAISQRTQTDTSAILLALYAITVSKVAGIHPVAVRSVINNRFRPGMADVVCAAAQAGVCVLDVADVTVDEAVERARRGSVLACKHSYYDPEDLLVLADRVTRERAATPDITRFFNDRRSEAGQKPLKTPITPALVREALATSEFRWTDRQDDPFERLFLHVDDGPDGPDSLVLYIQGDTHYYAPAQLEAMAHAIESTAVRAAFDSALTTGVSGARIDV